MSENQAPQVTRKQFLKLLAAAGGATAAAAFLPGKWVKPIVKMGVLPAHAQSSLNSPVTISSLGFSINLGKLNSKGNGLASPAKKNSISVPMEVQFDYNDPDSGMTDRAGLHLVINGINALSGETIAGQGGSITGPSTGTATFFLNGTSSYWYDCYDTPPAELHIVLDDSRESNTITTNLPPPPC
jgi:hypothetical protein